MRAFPINAIVDQAVYSPDGKTVLTGSSDKTARLWDVATGRLLHVLTDTAPVYAVAYAPDDGAASRTRLQRGRPKRKAPPELLVVAEIGPHGGLLF